MRSPRRPSVSVWGPARYHEFRNQSGKKSGALTSAFISLASAESDRSGSPSSSDSLSSLCDECDTSDVSSVMSVRSDSSEEPAAESDALADESESFARFRLPLDGFALATRLVLPV